MLQSLNSLKTTSPMFGHNDPVRSPLHPHHWCLSDSPFHRGSVRTMRSISFFQSMPSEMTRCHSLHTSSAEHSERASRKDRMFSAMWSRPWAAGGREGDIIQSDGDGLVWSVCVVNLSLINSLTNNKPTVNLTFLFTDSVDVYQWC